MESLLTTLWVYGISLFEGVVAYSCLIWIGGKKWHLSPWLSLYLLLATYFTFGGAFLDSFPFSNVIEGTLVPFLLMYFAARGIHGKKAYPALFIVFLFVNGILVQSALGLVVVGVFRIDPQLIRESVEYRWFHLLNHSLTLALGFGMRNYYYRAYLFFVGMLSKASKSVISIMLIQVVYLIVISLMMTAIILDIKASMQTQVLMFAIFLMFSIGTVVLVYLAHRLLKEQESRLSMSLQNQMQTSYDKVKDDIKGFWHSYANVMQVVKILVTTDHLEVSDVKNALEEFVVAHDRDQIAQKIQLIEIPHTILACILSSKAAYAEELGVHLDVNISGNGPIDINMRDLTEILGILLDNAIEVAHYADKEVSVKGSITDKSFNISLVNGVTRENEGINKYGISNGIGIGRVHSLIAKQKHINYSVNENTVSYEAILAVANRW